jgi:hypothetical protein
MATKNRIALLISETEEAFEAITRGVLAFVQTQETWALRWYGDARIRACDVERWAP